MKLTPKMALFFGVFGAVSVLAVSLAVFKQGETVLKQAAIAELTAKAEERRTRLRHWIDMGKNHIQTLASSSHLKKFLADHWATPADSPEKRGNLDLIAEELRVINEASLVIADIFLMHPQTARVFAATDADEVGRFKENRPYFLHGRDTLHLQPMYYSLGQKAPSVVISAPVTSASGNLMAVVSGRTDVHQMGMMVTGRQLPVDQANVYLVHTSGLFATQPKYVKDQAVLSRGVRTNASKQCLTRKNGAMADRDYRGEAVFSVYRWMPGLNLCLIAEMDQAVVFRSIKKLRDGILLSGLVVMLLGVGVAVAIAAMITGPIVGLQRGVSEIASGRVADPLPETRSEE